MATRKFKSTPELSLEDMTRILNNVYASCQVEPSEVPLETILSYSNYRQERYSLQKIVAIVAFLVFLVVPILFVAPKVTVTEGESGGSTYTSVYHIKVDNVIPVKRINASVNNAQLPVYESDNHEYIIQPTTNGTAVVTVTLMNYQTYTVDFEIASVDTTNPVLSGSSNDKKILHLYVNDGDGSGIDYEAIYGSYADGTAVTVREYDASIGEITLDYPNQEVNLFIPDKAGNTLHLLLSLK